MPAPFPTARDPMLSLLQSAASSVARRRAAPDPSAHPLVVAAAALAQAHGEPALSAAPTAAHAPPAGTAAPASTCAALGLDLLRALVGGTAAQQQALRDRIAFSQCDPLWAETLLDYARTLQPDGQPRAAPYIRYAALGDFVLPAPRNRARIALLSDWGTGTAEARAVASLLAAQRPDIVIHLGDIYFAGTAEECQAHFLAPLRAALPNTPLFSLCGNHDVYSGGEGYYGLLRELGQPASYFCLRSPDRSWQLLAADTGLHDRDPFDATASLTMLDPQEELWHIDKLRGFPGRTVLLSHHQPFSAYAQIGALAQHDPTNPNLMASHARLAAAGRIDAWFWGHEHRLCLYAPYRGVAAGRNIGYGAIPVAAEAQAPLPGLIDPPMVGAAVALDVVDGAWTHGFALLDCAPEGIAASYWAITRPGGPIHQEML